MGARMTFNFSSRSKLSSECSSSTATSDTAIRIWRYAAHAALLAIAITWASLAISPASAATLPTNFSETLLAGGLSNPTAMAFAPDGRLFVCQQGGQLRVIKNGVCWRRPSSAWQWIPTASAACSALPSIQTSPPTTSSTFITRRPRRQVHNRVSRFTASVGNPDVAAAGSEVAILDLNNLSGATNHNGGAIHFGPDGKLYIAVGENANPANSQSLGNLLGKILRINSDGTLPAG